MAVATKIAKQMQQKGISLHQKDIPNIQNPNLPVVSQFCTKMTKGKLINTVYLKTVEPLLL